MQGLKSLLISISTKASLGPPAPETAWICFSISAPPSSLNSVSEHVPFPLAFYSFLRGNKLNWISSYSRIKQTCIFKHSGACRTGTCRTKYVSLSWEVNIFCFCRLDISQRLTAFVPCPAGCAISFSPTQPVLYIY